MKSLHDLFSLAFAFTTGWLIEKEVLTAGISLPLVFQYIICTAEKREEWKRTEWLFEWASELKSLEHCFLLYGRSVGLLTSKSWNLEWPWCSSSCFHTGEEPREGKGSESLLWCVDGMIIFKISFVRTWFLLQDCLTRNWRGNHSIWSDLHASFPVQLQNYEWMNGREGTGRVLCWCGDLGGLLPCSVLREGSGPVFIRGFIVGGFCCTTLCYSVEGEGRHNTYACSGILSHSSGARYGRDRAAWTW